MKTWDARKGPVGLLRLRIVKSEKKASANLHKVAWPMLGKMMSSGVAVAGVLSTWRAGLRVCPRSGRAHLAVSGAPTSKTMSHPPCLAQKMAHLALETDIGGCLRTTAIKELKLSFSNGPENGVAVYLLRVIGRKI